MPVIFLIINIIYSKNKFPRNRIVNKNSSQNYIFSKHNFNSNLHQNSTIPLGSFFIARQKYKILKYITFCENYSKYLEKKTLAPSSKSVNECQSTSGFTRENLLKKLIAKNFIPSFILLKSLIFLQSFFLS